MRLFIIRHADPDYPNNTITPDGHLEAKALAKRLAQLGLDRIYCSPLGRARDTMQYTADVLHTTPTILDWTQELDLLKLKTPCVSPPISCAWDIPGEVLLNQPQFPSHENWHTLSDLQELNAKGVFEDLAQHSDDFLKSLGFERQGTRYKVVRPNVEKVAIFCHGGFGLTWLAHLLQIPLTIMWSGFWLPPTSVTTTLFDQRSPEWATPRCIGLSDTSHLYEAGIEIKPREIKANFE